MRIVRAFVVTVIRVLYLTFYMIDILSEVIVRPLSEAMQCNDFI